MAAEIQPTAWLVALHDKISMGNVMIDNPHPYAAQRMHKVPRSLQEVGWNYYVPKVVAIGPYYHGNPRFEQVESLKPLIVSLFFRRCGFNDCDISSLLTSIFPDEYMKKIMNDYILDENWKKKYSYNDFVLMIIVDAIFIIMFIEYAAKGVTHSLRMHINQVILVRRDVFLLENQIPYEVIKSLLLQRKSLPEKVHELWMDPKEWMEALVWFMNGESPFFRPTNTMDSPEEIYNLLDIYHFSVLCKASDEKKTTSWFGRLMRTFNKCMPKEVNDDKKRVTSRFKRFHMIFKSWVWREVKNDTKPTSWFWGFHGIFRKQAKMESKTKPAGVWLTHRRAKDLRSMGISFKLSKSNCLSDVCFKTNYIGAELTLPSITFDDTTLTMWLNLAAREIYKEPSNSLNPGKPSITSYICFLDSLIDHWEDVKELQSAGILNNFMGSEGDVARLFNKLAAPLVMNPRHYEDVKMKMNEYMHERWKLKSGKWGAEVVRVYLRSPWSVIAVMAGFVALSLTAVQTYFTIFPR